MIESKGGESIKGASIKDSVLIESDAGRRDARHRRPGDDPVLPDGPTAATRSPTSTSASAARFPLPLAAGGGYPELALALARGEQPEPRLGDFREGVVMTRFFWQTCLGAGEGGSLEALADELPEPVFRPE